MGKALSFLCHGSFWFALEIWLSDKGIVRVVASIAPEAFISQAGGRIFCCLLELGVDLLLRVSLVDTRGLYTENVLVG